MDKIDRKDRLAAESLKKSGFSKHGKTAGKDRPDRTSSKGRVDKRRYNVDRMDRIAGLIPFFV